MSVFRQQYTKPLPKGAVIEVQNGKRYARWTDRYGKKHLDPVTEGNDGNLRIIKQSKTYSIRYIDAAGVMRVESTGCTSRDAAETVRAEKTRRTELVKANVITAAEGVASDHAIVPLMEHANAYIQQLSLTVSDVHIKNIKGQLPRIIRECNFLRLTDITAEATINWLAMQKQRGMSARTRNTHRSALCSFCNWCTKTGRMMKNPISQVPKAQERTDPRHQRRALTVDETERLLRVARLRPIAEYGRAIISTEPKKHQRKRANWKRAALTYDDLDNAYAKGLEALQGRPDVRESMRLLGDTRYLTYLLLLTTGLRKGELRSIRKCQLSLNTIPALITLEARDEKNSQGAEIPLRPDVAEELREYLEALPQPLRDGDRVFDVPTALDKIFNADIAAADIPKRDGRGRVADVHCLRTTFGTHLSKAGVPLRTAQAAMRHSDPRLTANIYTDPFLLDVAGAMDKLPKFSATSSSTKTQDEKQNPSKTA